MSIKTTYSVFTFLLIFGFRTSYSQTKSGSLSKTDSLKLSLETEKQDTTKVKTLLLIAFNYYKSGSFNLAEEYALKGATLAEKTGNKKIETKALNNLGNIYKAENKLAPALQTHLKALRIRTETNDKTGEAVSLMNIGIVYTGLNDYDKALEYYTKCLSLKTQIGNRESMGALYNNFGNVYAEKKEFGKAGDYFLLALHEKENDKDTNGMAISTGLIGGNYDALLKYEKALEWYARSFELYKKTGDEYGCALIFNNIGRNYRKQKKYKQAEENFSKALKIATKNNYPEISKQLNYNLSMMLEEKGDSKKALDHYKNYIAFRDSIYNEENTKKIVQTEMNFEFEKKEAAAKLEQEKKEAVAAAENRKQKVIIWSVCGILVLVLVFAVFAYRSYLQKKKTNIEISLQKHIIEEKQKEILDSIHYARRIQQALLPTSKYISRKLNKE